jgi:hypothetical protein
MMTCIWNALLESWLSLLVALFFVDGSGDLFLNFMKPHHGLLTS